MADEIETPVQDDAPTPSVTLTDGALLEAVDADGWAWRCLLVQAGTSANGNHYPLPMLHEAAPVYAGVPVFYGRGPDHSPNERGVDSIAGYIVDPQPHPRGVAGTFEINRGKPDVREAVRHAWQVGQRTGRGAPFGFSHVIPRGGFEGRPRKPHGFEVTRIKRASSVDLVMSPAAGGGLLAPLAESQSFVPDALQEAIVTVEQMLERLRSGNALGPDDFARLTESVGGVAVADAIEAGQTAKPAPAAPVAVAAAPDTSAIDALNESVNARIAEIEQRAKLAEARATLTTMLAEAKLPEALATNIAADFDGRLFEASDLTARIDRDREMAAKLAGNRVTGLGAGVVVTEDQREKHQKAMDGLIWGKPVDGVKPFLTLKEAWQNVTGDYRYSYIDGDLPRRILADMVAFAGDDKMLAEAITSSTFGDILGDSIRRRLQQEYARPDRQTWRAISRVEPVVDFRTVERERMGGYGLLPTVGEGAPYQPMTTPGDEKATDSLDKYGGLESITMETIANDDMGVVRRIPVKMGYAAVDTLYNYIWNTVILNNAVASYDSKALYHTDHANTGTAALDEAGLSGVRVAMRNQTEYGNATTLPMGEANTPRIIAVPNELEIAAYKLVKSAVAITSTNDSTIPNFFSNGLDVVVVDSWTDANNWYAFADPGNVPTLEVGFFQGREEPELFVQDAQTVGSMFTADKVTYKIRHIWYVMVLEHRGTYRQVVT